MTAASPSSPDELRLPVARDLGRTLQSLADAGWLLDPQHIAGRVEVGKPTIYWSEPFQNVAAFGLFEAPSLDAAHSGITRLIEAGWGQTFPRTTWIVGPRDLPPSLGDRTLRAGPRISGSVGLERRLARRISRRTGRLRSRLRRGLRVRRRVGLRHLRPLRHLRHLGLGPRRVVGSAGPANHDRSMHGHEIQDDFMFTTSHHLIGRPIAVDRLEERLS